MFWIVFIVITVVEVGIFLTTRIPQIHEFEEIAEKTFVCSNCGHRFHVKKSQIFYKWKLIYLYKGIPLKCPACKSRDFCTPSQDN